MKFKSTQLKKHLLLFMSILFSAMGFSQSAVTVTECDLNGWQRASALGATGIISFVNGPANPPLGKGSVKYQYFNDKKITRLKNNEYGGTLLSSISELSYSTYVQQRSNTKDNAFIVLQIDLDNNGQMDYPLVFNTEYQTGGWINGTFPDQGPSVMNTWQSWNLLIGGWWRGVPNPDPDHGGALITITSIIQEYPNAKIINTTGLGGSIRINGSSLVFAGPSTVYVDAFKIKVDGTKTAYDFEGDRLLVCHNGESLCIASAALQGHLAHGDNLGECPAIVAKSAYEYIEPAIISDKLSITNYPNPSHGVNTIKYELPSDSKVSISVHDLTGRNITNLVNENKTAGNYSFDFNTSKLKSGIYYYKITVTTSTKSITKTSKVVVVE